MRDSVRAAGFALLALGLPGGTKILAQEVAPAGRFLGGPSCQSSSCHGGAGPERNQYLVWSEKDYHSRAYAILTTARSARMAEVLQLESATASVRCTVCHSPFQTLPPAALGPAAHRDEGVSCESCHNAAEPWLRSHTRKDFTYAQRITSGMRDLKSIYVRANSCVACHENLSRDLVEAGHPQLLFELDGMTAAEPPHWQDHGEWFGPRAWLAGQAAALREASWQAGRDQTATARGKALGWLLQKVTAEIQGVPVIPAIAHPTGDDFSRLAQASDELARAADKWNCHAAVLVKLLRVLAGSAPDIRGAEEPAHRARALLLALDRITAALERNGTALPDAAKALAILFADAKQTEAFDAARFATHLDEFAATLPKQPHE